MCQGSNHIVLTETSNAQISWCKGCKNYSIIFNSCCFGFNHEELLGFKQVLHRLTDDDYHYSFMDTKYAIIKRDRSSLGVTLSKNDTEAFISLIDEALAMKEVFGIIYQ